MVRLEHPVRVHGSDDLQVPAHEQRTSNYQKGTSCKSRRCRRGCGEGVRQVTRFRSHGQSSANSVGTEGVPGSAHSDTIGSQ